MLIVYAPDAQAKALGETLGAMDGCRCLPMAQADTQAVAQAEALILVLPDYYTHACWEMKRWLTGQVDALAGKLCSCISYCACGGGGELALRTIISQLLPSRCLIYQCGLLCSDGRIHLGGDAACSAAGLTPAEFHTGLCALSTRFT